jgi:class 3 adenylate cyclase
MSDPYTDKQTDTNTQNMLHYNLQREISYYKKLADEVAGYNIRIDSQISLLKRGLHQKQNGFTILSSLHDVFGHHINTDELLNETLKLINTTLKMDRSIIVWTKDGSPTMFEPKWSLGYISNEEESIKSSALDLSELLKTDVKSILVNKETVSNEMIEAIRNQWKLNFFIAVPIRNDGQVSGWMLAGREKEAWPFYPPLNNGDRETLFAIASFMEAALANARLYFSLEKANKELEAYNQELEKRVAERTRDLEMRNHDLAIEKKRSDDLLLNILPAETAEELKKYGSSKARHFDEATVMFTDFVNFTLLASIISPAQLVSELDHCFRHFDEIITRNGLEKIKTIGDAHMSVGGITGNGSIAANVIQAGIEIRDFVTEYSKTKPPELQKFFNVRVGIHTGIVVAGIVGLKKFSYDIWGDTVNMAARMQSSSQPGKVNVSETTYELAKDDFDFESRGKIAAKNKGEVLMFFAENK